jgi:hypothetical protein
VAAREHKDRKEERSKFFSLSSLRSFAAKFFLKLNDFKKEKEPPFLGGGS